MKKAINTYVGGNFLVEAKVVTSKLTDMLHACLFINKILSKYPLLRVERSSLSTRYTESVDTIRNSMTSIMTSAKIYKQKLNEVKEEPIEDQASWLFLSSDGNELRNSISRIKYLAELISDQVNKMNTVAKKGTTSTFCGDIMWVCAFCEVLDSEYHDIMIAHTMWYERLAAVLVRELGRTNTEKENS